MELKPFAYRYLLFVYLVVQIIQRDCLIDMTPELRTSQVLDFSALSSSHKKVTAT